MQERDTYRVPEKYDVRVYWERTKLSLAGQKVDVSRRDGEGVVKGVRIADGSVLYCDKYHHEAQYAPKEGDKINVVEDSGVERVVKRVLKAFV